MSDDVECNANGSLSLKNSRADSSNDSHRQASKIAKVNFSLLSFHLVCPEILPRPDLGGCKLRSTRQFCDSSMQRG